MEKKQIYEIMSKTCDNTGNLFGSLSILNTLGEVNLIQDKNFDTIYSFNIADLVESEISIEQLTEIRNDGWEIDSKGEFIIKNLNKSSF